MVSPVIDRRLGLAGNNGAKQPVTVVATTNVTQSGEQTISGIALLASNAADVPDRVLCTAQTDPIYNGVWEVQTGSWVRPDDMNGTGDIVRGTQVRVARGLSAGTTWYMTAADPVVIGTSSQTWSQDPAATETTISYGAVVSIIDGVLTQHASLAAAVSAIGSTRCTVVVRDDITMAASATFPTTATLRIENNAQITTTGYTLTCNGPFECHPVQCFAGTGTVAFGHRSVRSVFPQWWGAIGDGSTSCTTPIQTAINVVAATTDNEKALEFLPGDYRVTTLDFTQMRQCKIICNGAVFITGTSTTDTAIIEIDALEADACLGLQMVGTMAVQTAVTGYSYGLYARWLTNSVINMSISGGFSVSGADFDGCFDNDFQWLYVANTTAAKHHIKCGSNNNNVNRWRVRVAGSGSANTQVGMELDGNANIVFGDISACGEGLRLVASRGAMLSGLYFEACLTPVTADGLNRGNTFLGGYVEVLDGSTGMDFSGGSQQGLNLIGVYFNGATGTTTGVNLGTGSYGVNIIGCDMNAIDTEITGTLRGTTGGVNAQLHGATRYYSNGSQAALGGTAQAIVSQTVAGAGTVAIDASAGDEQYLTVSTGLGFTIGAPTNPTTGQLLTLSLRNTSGGALGVITWDAAFKVAAWTSPATANSRSIVFRYDGTNWVERFRTPADVPN